MSVACAPVIVFWRAMRPDSACTIGAYAARRDSGPLLPKPEIDSITSRGLTAFSTS